MTHAFDPYEPFDRNAPNPDESQTAMLLTEQEWEDLAAIAQGYLNDTNWLCFVETGHPGFLPGGRFVPTDRRRALARRIIEAAS